MTAIAALTLNDGQTTPVAHTFSPVTIDASGVARWEDRVAGIAIGFPAVTYSLRRPTKASKSYKLMAKVVLPVTEVIAPSTFASKAFDLIATVEMVIPDRASLAQRKDLLAYTRNMLAHALITAGVENFESVY